MPTRSESEGALRDATLAALNHGGTNPWGPVGQALAKAAGLEAKFARAIGMQDDTVIGRAITSPGMSKSHLQVHGFVILPETTLQSAVDRIVDEVQRLPYLRTAVLIPTANDYYPSHIISREPAIAQHLAAEYPNASLRDDLQFSGGPRQAVGGAEHTHTGPWLVLTAVNAAPRTVAIPADSPWGRSISPGDYVVLATASDESRSAYAVGIINAVARADTDLLLELHPVRAFDNHVPLSVVRAEHESGASS